MLERPRVVKKGVAPMRSGNSNVRNILLQFPFLFAILVYLLLDSSIYLFLKNMEEANLSLGKKKKKSL